MEPGPVYVAPPMTASSILTQMNGQFARGKRTQSQSVPTGTAGHSMNRHTRTVAEPP